MNEPIYIPDPIERGEASAERAWDERFDGHLFTCYCGKKFDPDKEGGTVSPNPYAMPVCDDCYEQAFPTEPEPEKP